MPRTQQQREDLGHELTALRLEAGFATISELAASDIGVSSKTIGNAEAGRVVSEQTIQRIRSFLMARRREAMVSRPGGAAFGYTLGGERYGQAIGHLRDWLDELDEATPLHPPTDSLWLWSPGQLSENLADQVGILEEQHERLLHEHFGNLAADINEAEFGTGEDEDDDDATPTKEAGRAGHGLKGRAGRGRSEIAQRLIRANALSDEGHIVLPAVAFDDDSLVREREAQQEGP